MQHAFSRTELIIGPKALEKLSNSTVAVFGVGGVGSFVVEGLARSGVGNFVLVDDDLVCLTNINRQLQATHKTIGTPKVEAMKDRILTINPKANVTTHQTFYLPDCETELIVPEYDYIVDAIDTVTAKLDICVKANRLNIPLIASMGTGNKLDPTLFEITDINKTSVCPLCKVMRKELKKRKINKLKVVYSKEIPQKPGLSSSNCHNACVCPAAAERKCTDRRAIPGSISFVPSVAGLIIAGEVIKDLIKN